MIQRKTISKTNKPLNDFSNPFKRINSKLSLSGEYHLQNKPTPTTTGWIIYISVIPNQITKLINDVIPILLKNNVVFKLAKNIETAEQLSTGSLGPRSVGKIISIYPETDEQSTHLAKLLITRTNSLNGPAIPTAAALSSCIYVWFGQRDTPDELMTTPFKLPTKIHWPFNAIRTKPTSNLNILNGSYLILKEMKIDIKGRVLKALWFNGLKIKLCIIKEGLHDMSIDQNGRDMRDRIHWQHIVQSKLNQALPVPNSFQIFSDSGNTYTSMEQVKGKTLHDIIECIHTNTPWQKLETEKKLKLIKYSRQILDITKDLHNLDYVHRDISTSNFIVTPKDRVLIIDFELAYNTKLQQPNPPFNSGRNAYTAPERSLVKTPSEKEDIYSIGAVLYAIFTGTPLKVGQTSNLDKLAETCNLLIGNKNLEQIIINCLNPKSHLRPNLATIINELETYTKLIENSTASEPISNSRIDKALIKVVTSESLLGLNEHPMLNKNFKWQSNLDTTEKIRNTQTRTTTTIGLARGISGPIYLLSAAKELNYDTSHHQKVIKINIDHVISEIEIQKNKLDSGLYNGMSGAAIALSKALSTNLTNSGGKINEIIPKCFNLETQAVDMASGQSGIGLAALHLNDTLSKSINKDISHQCAAQIQSMQTRNGSWTKNGSAIHGFSHGTAGTILFLLEYISKFHDERYISTCQKGLSYLLNIHEKTDHHSDKTHTESPWLEHGATGIALVFLRAFKLFQDQRYQKIAEKILRKFPPNIISNKYSFLNGLCGLGEVYIEANTILKSEEWYDRAIWICKILSSTRQGNRLSCHWVMENHLPPTADLFIGNSGITHLFLRAENLQKIPFPLLTN